MEIVLVLGFLIMIVICGACAVQSSGASMIVGSLGLFMMLIGGANVMVDRTEREAVKQGVAEWVQVVQDNGSVKNEFKWIKPITDE